MAFVWRTSVNRDDIPRVSPGSELAARICISFMLFTGIVYLTLIIRTLGRYGERMDIAWKEKVRNAAASSYNVTFLTTPPEKTALIAAINAPSIPPVNTPQISPSANVLPVAPGSGTNSQVTSPRHATPSLPMFTQSPRPSPQPLSGVGPSMPLRHPENSVGPWHSSVIFQEAIEVVKLESRGCIPSAMPQYLYHRGIRDALWRSFIHVSDIPLSRMYIHANQISDNRRYPMPGADLPNGNILVHTDPKTAFLRSSISVTNMRSTTATRKSFYAVKHQQNFHTLRHLWCI